MPYQLPDQLKFLQNRKAPQHTTTASLSGKWVVITGATSGVGYQAAHRLASAGANLILINRNEQKATALKNDLVGLYHVGVDSYIADFTSLKQVEEVAAMIVREHPSIDVLINCAGLHSTRKSYTDEGFETVFAVNHLASFLLTDRLLPSLKAAAPSRIIQVNSEGHRFNGLRLNDLHWKKRWRYTGLKGYGASKSAQLLTVFEWAPELAKYGVTINAMHPGDVKTNIGQNNGRLYRWFSKVFISRILDDPKKSGEALYYLAAAPELHETTGKFFHLTIEEKPASHVLNPTLGKKIFDETIRMINSKAL